MPSTHLETLRWQYTLTWKLASDYHLPQLTDDACLWEPSPVSWTVRRAPDGNWKADFATTEPAPVPTVTIGWSTWQIIWWWSGLIAAVRGETPRPPQEVFWPGNASAVREQLQQLDREWIAILASLTDADLERPLSYPWPDPQPLRLALAWANSELMKNVSEIGYARHLFEISRLKKQ